MTMQLRKKAKKDQTIQTLILLNQRPKILQKSLKMGLMLNPKMELMLGLKMELMPNPKMELKKSLKVLEVLARKDQIMDITLVLYRPVRDMMMEIQSTQAIIALA